MIYHTVNTSISVLFGPVLAVDGTMSSGALVYTDFRWVRNGVVEELDPSTEVTHIYEGQFIVDLIGDDFSGAGNYALILKKNPLSAAPLRFTVFSQPFYQWLFSETGIINANLVAILGTAFDGNAAWIAAAFKKFFNVGTPVLTVASVNQTIDNPTADAVGTDAASKVLKTPANKLATDANGKVTYSNEAPPTVGAIRTEIETVGGSLALTKTAAEAVQTVLTGITSMAAWLRGLFRKDTMNSTAKTEVNANGGAFNEATDSIEALRDTAPMGSAMRGTDGAYTGTPPTADAIGTDAAHKILTSPYNPVAVNVNGKVAVLDSQIVGSVTGSVGSVVSYGTLAADVALAVWAAGTRTLTSYGMLVAEIWAGATATLMAFGSWLVTAIGEALSTAHGAGSWKEGTSSGAGAFTVTVTVTDGTDVLENVTVRYTSGVDTYTAVTGMDGEAVFNLDAATYVVAATRAGYAYAGGTHVVAGDDEKAIEMTAVVVSPPDDPAQTTAYGVTRRADGIAEPNVRVLVKLVTPTSEGQHSRRELSIRSGPDGAYQIELLKSAAYWMRRDKGPTVWTKFTTTEADTFDLPII